MALAGSNRKDGKLYPMPRYARYGSHLAGALNSLFLFFSQILFHSICNVIFCTNRTCQELSEYKKVFLYFDFPNATLSHDIISLLSGGFNEESENISVPWLLLS